MFEIERQFLLDAVPKGVLAGADRVVKIRQGYLTTVPPAIRVRELDGTFLMTIKSGGTLVRREVEFEIPEPIARQLFSIAEERVIEKTRYVMGPWEIDVFHGRHDGVFVAEFEMVTPDDPLPPLPEGLRAVMELTHEPTFSNQILAQLGERETRMLLCSLLGSGGSSARPDGDSA